VLAGKIPRLSLHGRDVSYYHAITCRMLPYQLNMLYVLIFSKHDYAVVESDLFMSIILRTKRFCF
jgi:hypothetical protein